MEFKIKSAKNNAHPLSGLLLRGHSLGGWTKEIQRLQLSLRDIQVYPLPGLEANAIWGCLVVSSRPFENAAGAYERCQVVADRIFIPERSTISPSLNDLELQRLFAAGLHVMHPDFGLVLLGEPVQWEQSLALPTELTRTIRVPSGAPYLPERIRSFRVQSLAPEEIVKNLTERVFPKTEPMIGDKLNWWERIQLYLYTLLFSRTGNNPTSREGGNPSSAGNRASSSAEGRTAERSWLKQLISKVMDERRWQHIEEHFENLEERNKNEIDKLLSLLKSNPAEALKYAIPLDEHSAPRGGDAGIFSLLKRWSELSWATPGTANVSGGATLGNDYHKIHAQYLATAEALLKNGDYQKAAFVYMKLLKRYDRAAEVLEQGRLYQEAAVIYLRYASNKLKAADCYEKGNCTLEAIDLYKEMKAYEKVGDLHMALGETHAASRYYELTLVDHVAAQRYYKGALLISDKLNDNTRAQRLLLDGWKTEKEAVRCLSTYFSNITDDEMRWKQIRSIHQDHVSPTNCEAFVDVLKAEFKKRNRLSEPVKELAYEIIAERLKSNPDIANVLREFNPNDNELRKDTLRFRMRKK